MCPAPGDATPSQRPGATAGGFIRGSGGTEISGRRLFDVLAAACVAALVVVAALLSISAVHQANSSTLLHQRGVPVQVTVSGCLAISSGIGMGVEYWRCHGTYTLDGQRYDEVISGSRGLLEAGATVAAVAVPAHPGLLSTPQAAAHHPSWWSRYLPPMAVGAGAVAVLGVWLGVISRRRRSQIQAP